MENVLHKQQTPIQLLLRIILSSTNQGDVVLDPFAGSGTTLVVSKQLGRKSIGIEIDAFNVELIQNRLAEQRESDYVSRFFKDYTCTPDLETIWGNGQSVPHNLDYCKHIPTEVDEYSDCKTTRRSFHP